MSDTSQENLPQTNGHSSQNKKLTYQEISLICLLCIITLVPFGLGVAWTITNGYTHTHLLSGKNTHTDMEKCISQFETAYSTSHHYNTPAMVLPNSLRLCQTNVNDHTPSTPTESSTTKTKPLSPVGNSEKNQLGGTKSEQTTSPE